MSIYKSNQKKSDRGARGIERRGLIFIFLLITSNTFAHFDGDPNRATHWYNLGGVYGTDPNQVCEDYVSQFYQYVRTTFSTERTLDGEAIWDCVWEYYGEGTYKMAEQHCLYTDTLKGDVCEFDTDNVCAPFNGLYIDNLVPSEHQTAANISQDMCKLSQTGQDQLAAYDAFAWNKIVQECSEDDAELFCYVTTAYQGSGTTDTGGCDLHSTGFTGGEEYDYIFQSGERISLDEHTDSCGGSGIVSGPVCEVDEQPVIQYMLDGDTVVAGIEAAGGIEFYDPSVDVPDSVCYGSCVLEGVLVLAGTMSPADNFASGCFLNSGDGIDGNGDPAAGAQCVGLGVQNGESCDSTSAPDGFSIDLPSGGGGSSGGGSGGGADFDDSGIISAVESMNDNLSGRMTAGFTGLGVQLDGISGEIGGLGDSIDGLGTAIDGIGDKIDGIADGFNQPWEAPGGSPIFPDRSAEITLAVNGLTDTVASLSNVFGDPNLSLSTAEYQCTPREFSGYTLDFCLSDSSKDALDKFGMLVMVAASFLSIAMVMKA